MSTPTTENEPFVEELVTALCGLREPIEPWHLKPTENGAVLLVGQRTARVRGTLDGAGYSVRESDLPVREGFDGVLEIQP